MMIDTASPSRPWRPNRTSRISPCSQTPSSDWSVKLDAVGGGVAPRGAHGLVMANRHGTVLHWITEAPQERIVLQPGLDATSPRIFTVQPGLLVIYLRAVIGASPRIV